MNQSLHTRHNWGLFIIRLGVGVVFIVHGLMKVVDLSGTADFFGGIGLPIPLVFAVLVAAIELLGGIALIIGLYTQGAAILIAVVMIGAIVLVKGAQGFIGAAELDFMLLTAAIGIALLGPGDLRLRFRKGSRGSDAPEEVADQEESTVA